MTLEEIDILIHEFGVAQFNCGVHKDWRNRSHEAKNKLWEAIIEYGRESAEEAFEIGHKAGLEEKEK